MAYSVSLNVSKDDIESGHRNTSLNRTLHLDSTLKKPYKFNKI